MLKSLIGTGLQARLSHEQYEKYKAEIAAIDDSWAKSLSELQNCKLSSESEGIEDKYIPIPYCQYDYNHIIYDYRECRTLSAGESLPKGYKTMADGGTIPCALMTLLDYFKTAPNSLEDIGTVLVENGYRTKSSGTLWVAVDKVLNHYHVRAEIQPSVETVFDRIRNKRPVIAIVSGMWLHDMPHLPTMTNECIIIWRIEGNQAVFTTTSRHSPKRENFYDLLKHTKRAWACQKFS